MKQKVTPTQKALNLWAVILIVWAVYRTYFKFPEWFDEFIAKPLVFVLPVLVYIKKVDKKKISEALSINLSSKKFVSDLIYSAVIGLIFIGAAFTSNFMKMGKIFLAENIMTSGFVSLFLFALATGITEEILSRGFVLKKLYEESGNFYSSIFFSSILFFFLHIPILFANAKITGNMLLFFMATDLFLSIINGVLFLRRKSLMVPVLVHILYNVAVGMMFI